MDVEQIWRTVEAERLRLAELLERLPAAAWDTPSLCEGWRVRDVAAHLTIPTRLTVPRLLFGVIRARGDANRFIADDARRRSQRQPAELVADLRRVASDRRHPPPTKPEDPLVDVLVHGQDLAIPLGIRHAMPVEAAAAGAEHVWRSSFPFRARRRLAGHRLVATDAEWTAGEGEVLEAPVERLLLAMTGRLRVDDLRAPVPR